MQKTETIYVSIIIPVYNVKTYIRACVDSILSCIQNYSCEVVLIDDGSTDGSSQICDELSRFPCVRCTHQANAGISAARNLGLRIAKGEYVAFVDGDDYVDQLFLSTLIDSYRGRRADIVVGSYAAVFDDGRTQAMVLPGKKSGGEISVEEVYEVLHSPSSGIFLCAWNKLFRKSLFGDDPFPVGRIVEDAATIPMIYEKARCVVYDPEITYYYRQRAGSIMSEKRPLFWYSLFRSCFSLSEFYAERLYYRYSSLNLWDSFIGLSLHKKWPENRKKEYKKWRAVFRSFGKVSSTKGLGFAKRFILFSFVFASINLYPLIVFLRRNHAAKKIL